MANLLAGENQGSCALSKNLHFLLALRDLHFRLLQSCSQTVVGEMTTVHRLVGETAEGLYNLLAAKRREFGEPLALDGFGQIRAARNGGDAATGPKAAVRYHIPNQFQAELKHVSARRVFDGDGYVGTC
jgi:hypothetical protein